VEEIASFRVHPGHPFEGMLLTGRRSIVAAMCSCGAVLCWADAVFASCEQCDGTGIDSTEGPCLRCGGSGEVVDHAALEWRPPTMDLRKGDRDG
jgi:hypothetical protein